MQKEDIAYAPSSGEDFGRIVELPKPHPNGLHFLMDAAERIGSYKDSYFQVDSTYMYMFIYLFINVFICTYLYICIYLYVYIHIHIYIYTYISACIHVCIFVYICIDISSLL
jgi:hypothetical protein